MRNIILCMPPQPAEADLLTILAAVKRQGSGMSLAELKATLSLGERTLQYRLAELVKQGRLTRSGKGRGRWTRYSLPTSGPSAFEPEPPAAEPQPRRDPAIPLSPASEQIRVYLAQPVSARAAVGYNRQFLDAYQPNVTFYLSTEDRATLARINENAEPAIPEAQAAGTYARQLLTRLLIDLSWNSSRLEGNTYSLLDTKRLIEFGQEAEGRDHREAQMIVNHKEAIEFLVGAADEIGLNRYTLLNLHAMLADNLLPDDSAAGRLRHIAVGIEGSAFRPLAVPQLIEECFTQLLATASAIRDPFEQAFFLMVHLPYLQPFDDVNKRVSRLAANIPFIRQNLSPLSFIGVPRALYTQAVLGVYELNQVDLLKDVFLWAYARSAQQYTSVRQSLGEPDPFRFRYSNALRQAVAEAVRGRMPRLQAAAHLAAWTDAHIDAADRERFREIAEADLLNLHEGNFARYRIRPSEFEEWQKIWARKAF
jgi:Fic family protein